jgi:hypothetical protein
MIDELAYGQSNHAGNHIGERFVRCIDNTLATDVLTIGRIYEVVQIKERDGYYVLSLGEFTMARFRPVSAVEAGDG